MWKYNCPNEGKHEYTRCSFVEPFMKYSHNALSLSFCYCKKYFASLTHTRIVNEK